MSARRLVAFSALILVIHELHELAHTATGRLLCGGWGGRDFNSWFLPEGCNSWVPTLMGPLFSYLVMLVGALLTRRDAHRPVGLALLFAANPFARLFTAVMGGGDEMVLARAWSGIAQKTPMLRAAVLLVVGAICVTFIVIGWRATRGFRRRVLTFITMLLWPMILTGVLLFAIFNPLLKRGVLATPGLGGEPLFVTIVTAASLLMLAVTARWLKD
jgi:hypothetical protein